MCCFQENHDTYPRKNFLMGLTYLAVDKVPGYYEEQKIPNRYGVKGYAGGDNWCHHGIPFREDLKVAEAALGFLPLLGSDTVIEPRPEIFLHEREISTAESQWGPRCPFEQRIVIAPGGGFPENAGETKTLLS